MDSWTVGLVANAVIALAYFCITAVICCPWFTATS